MNNDEFMQQVLNELKSINGRLGTLEQGQAKLEQGQAKLEQGQVKLEQEVTETKSHVILIENDHGRHLNALHDGFKLMYDKLDPLPAAVENLQDDVSLIKAVVTSHSDDIITMKSAM